MTAAGGIGIPDLGLALFFPLICIALCLLIGARAPDRKTAWVNGFQLPARWLLLVPAFGLLTAGALAALQLSAEGELSYYFWKYLIGTQIVCVAILAVPVAAFLAARPAVARNRVRVAVAGVAVTVAASQAFGATVPALTRDAVSPAAPLIAHLAGTELRIDDPPAAAVIITVVEDLMRDHPGQRLLYLSVPADGRTLPYVMTQWSLALTGRWTTQAQAAVSDLHLDESDSWAPTLTSMVSGIRRVLRADADTMIVVAPETLSALRGLLSDPDLTDRIVSW